MSNIVLDSSRPGAPIISQELGFDIADMRSFLYEHPNSTYVRWWRAVADPTFDPRTATPQTTQGHQQWLREEQDVRKFRAVVSGHRIAAKYWAQGVVRTGDIMVTTMRDELPVSSHDQVVPIGKILSHDGTYPDARVDIAKEVIVRGSVATAMIGTVTNMGTAVLGTGTEFTKHLRVGSAVSSGRQNFIIAGISSDTLLNLDHIPNPGLNANNITALSEAMTYSPVASIDEIRDSTKKYINGTDYLLASDGVSIQWLLATAPVAGTRLSMTYRYLQMYVCLPDLGITRAPVNGVPMLQSVLCRLWGTAEEAK